MLQPSSSAMCEVFFVFSTTHSPLCPIISHSFLFFLTVPFSELPLPVVLLSEQLFTRDNNMQKWPLLFETFKSRLWWCFSHLYNSTELLCMDPWERVKEERTRVGLASKVPHSGGSGEQSDSSSSTALVQSKIPYRLVLTVVRPNRKGHFYG